MCMRCGLRTEPVVCVHGTSAPWHAQWYSEMMMMHADRVLGAAERTLRGSGARMSARVPCVHWWYNSASHAAECTAGYYATRERDAYLPVFKVLEAHGAGAQLRTSEMRHHEVCEVPPQHARRAGTAGAGTGWCQQQESGLLGQ